MRKDIHDQDDFLARFEQMDPHFAELLRERFWTPHQLVRVPDSHLSAKLRELSYVQVASLLIHLPEDIAKRVETLLPDGNLRVMALDQRDRMIQRGSEKDKRIAAIICGQFIDALREEAQERVFELLPEEKAATEREAA